jgi:hypothetical protein
MRTLYVLSESKQKRIAQETLDIFAPLANRLGIWQMKWELEDQGFRYVNPEKYSITWKFYSTKDGREVKADFSGPTNIIEAPEPLYKENPELEKGDIEQLEWEAAGADVNVKRTVTRNGEPYLTDAFNTHYEPWQAVFEYGPGTEGIPTPSAEEETATPTP